MLYRRLCATCHGESGDGRGPAARYVFPKPRDFRLGKFKLVTTANRVASREDLLRVLEQGVPGTSMQAWKSLGRPSLESLVDHVLALTREGLTQHLQREAGGEVSDERLRANVEQRLTPSEPAALPTIPPSTPERIASGQAIYLAQKCQTCHGADGRGIWKADLRDEWGQPTWSRDLVADPLKGGASGAALAARIRLGMPGSAMPASPQLSDAALADLVLYCQSLAAEPKRQLTNHQRAMRAIGLKIEPRLPTLPTP